MKKKTIRIKPFNLFDLLHTLFGRILCDPESYKFKMEGGNIIASIQSGPMEGLVVMLSYSATGAAVTIYRDEGDAKRGDVQYSIVSFQVSPSENHGMNRLPLDASRGQLYYLESQLVTPLGLTKLQSTCPAAYAHIASFYALMKNLTCQYVWDDEATCSLSRYSLSRIWGVILPDPAIHAN